MKLKVISNSKGGDNVRGSYILVLLIAIAVLGTIAAVASPTTVSQTNAQKAEVQKDIQEPSYTGSIKAPQINDEDQETKTLEGYAKITPKVAENAALAEVPGKVIKVSLDNENGYVVYSVEISTNAGVKDVKVDAGTGQVLYVDIDNEHEGSE